MSTLIFKLGVFGLGGIEPLLIGQNNCLLFAIPGGGELLMIGLMILLLFGGKKIPELMKGLGQGISDFKKSSRGEDPVDSKILDNKN